MAIGAVGALVMLGVLIVGLLGPSDDPEPLSVLATTPNGSPSTVLAEPVDPPDDTTADAGAATAGPPLDTTAPTGDDSIAPDEPENSPSSAPTSDPIEPPDDSATDAPDADPAEGGPATEPLSLGAAAPIGDRFVVTVTAVDPDATDLITSFDPTNQPPAPGNGYVMVTLDVEFVGAGEGEPYFELNVGAVDDAEREYVDIDCVAFAPDDMYDVAPLTSGDAVVGTFCLVVPLDAIESLTFFVEENQPAAGNRVWWLSSV